MNKLPQDKLYHLLAGVGISFLFAVGFSSLLAGILAAAAAGILKEAWDYYHPEGHTVDVWDALFTMFGGLIPPVLYFFLALF